MSDTIFRYPKRPKLALTSFWPAFVPHPVRVSDSNIQPQPAGDNITQYTPYGLHAVDDTPHSWGPKPWTGAFDISDVPIFGPSGIGAAAGPHGPTTPNAHEPAYLGLPQAYWRPFQPQPPMYFKQPPANAETAFRIPAGAAVAR